MSAWQVFFFTGLFLGWHHATLTERLANFPRKRMLAAAAVAFALLIALYKLSGQLIRLWPSDPGRAQDVQLWLLEWVFAKADVRPGRIVASLVVFGLFYLLVTEAWRPLSAALGWLLIPLGQGALYAYSAHVIIALPVALVLDRLIIADRFARPLYGTVQIAVVLLIWALLRWRVLDVNPTRGRARYLWPAGATAACLVVVALSPSATPHGVALAQAAAVPDPYAARVARAFGTPVPGKPPPTDVTPIPLPTPRAPQLTTAGSTAPASDYVGPLKGDLQFMQFFSPALDREMQYFIYFPPGYGDERRRYPVLYMLHGNSGSAEEWVAYGLIDAADRMILRKEILPLVIVLPQGDYSYWVNHVPDGPGYGDYLSEDVVRHIAATYRVLPGGEHHAIGGLSMGATGALVEAFKNPDHFRVVGAHSPALPYEGERDFLGIGEDFASRSPTVLAERAERLHELSIWIDIGDQDDWAERNAALHETLARRDVDHIWDLWPGGEHWGDYWARRVPDYLLFYDAALNPKRRL